MKQVSEKDWSEFRSVLKIGTTYSPIASRRWIGSSSNPDLTQLLEKDSRCRDHKRVSHHRSPDASGLDISHAARDT